MVAIDRDTTCDAVSSGLSWVLTPVLSMLWCDNRAAYREKGVF